MFQASVQVGKTRRQSTTGAAVGRSTGQQEERVKQQTLLLKAV